MQINKLYKDNEIITLDSYLTKCGVIDTEEYLHPYYNELDDPFQYLNMALGVEMFQKHFDALSDTYIICDSDLDGIVSTVIMYQYMKALNKNWNIGILIHKGKVIATGTPKEIEKSTKTNNLRDAFFNLIGGVENEME